MTRGSKPNGMGANCSCKGEALLIASGLLTAAEVALSEGKVAIGAAGDEGEAGALVDVLSEVPGEEAAAGVEEEAAGASRVGGDEGEAVDGDATGADVTGLDGIAG